MRFLVEIEPLSDGSGRHSSSPRGRIALAAMAFRHRNTLGALTAALGDDAVGDATLPDGRTVTVTRLDGGQL